MHREFLKIFLLTGGLVLGLALHAQALSVANKLNLFGDVGFCTVAMADINSEMIQPINDLMSAMRVSGSIDLMQRAGTFGGGVQYGITDYLLVGAEAGSIIAQTEGWFPMPLGPTVGYIYFLPLFTAGVTAKYAWPVSDTILLTAGAGMDYLSLNGKLEITDSVSTYTTQLNGTGIGAKVLAGGQLFLSEHFSLGVDVGYRLAVIPEIKDQDGVVAKKRNGENMTADFSGLIARLVVGMWF